MEFSRLRDETPNKLVCESLNGSLGVEKEPDRFDIYPAPNGWLN